MIVSFTIVRYRKRFIPFAFLAMVLHRLPLQANRECTFWKLLGSGRPGTFDVNPDWQHWALLAVWRHRPAAEAFFQRSFIARWWNFFEAECCTLLCEPVSGHGKWDRREPFNYADTDRTYQGPVAVLTRATIRLKRLPAFWSHIDPVVASMKNAPGYLVSFGIGEAPVYKQGTFSLWKNAESLKNFAYATEEHREVIQKRQDENWYSEELFARFKPVTSFGTLSGENPFRL